MGRLAHRLYTLILSTLLAIKVHSPRRDARSWLHTPCSAKRLRSHAKIGRDPTGSVPQRVPVRAKRRQRLLGNYRAERDPPNTIAPSAADSAGDTSLSRPKKSGHRFVP
jgi:hypothetical protein